MLTIDITEMNNEMVEKVPNLNRGVCGYFAYKMWLRMYERFGIKCEIIEFRHKERNNKHIMLKQNGQYFDGYRNINNLTDVEEHNQNELTIADLVLQLLLDNWNSEYDKDKFNPIVDELIEKYV